MKELAFAIILITAVVASAQFFSQSQRQLDDNQNVRNIISPTPQPCKNTIVPSNIEGPYYKDGSPERAAVIDEGTQGTPLTLSGYVYDSNCDPIARAWIDFWQADGNGNYDNEGYRLRGHQYTDTNGKYMLNTVLPGEYPGRTPHIHVKVKGTTDSPVITTQLYIPNAEKNQTDTLFTEETLIDIIDSENGIKATYDFILNVD